ncbi:MAG: dihydrolipoamide acetyltransferase family protein [Pseudomonadales bacterium]
MKTFKLPDLGEGLPDAEIVEWLVSEGDEVALDQNIVAMETAKAIVEIPSPRAGVIGTFFGQPGDIIETGAALFDYRGDEEKSPDSSTSVVGEIPTEQTQVHESAQRVSTAHTIGVKATPAVRALARHHDVDLSCVTPSGPNDTVTATDVERVADIFARVGKLEPLKGVRRAMAKTMSMAHAEVVPVTLNDDANLSAWSSRQDITVRLAQAIVYACDVEPALNLWYDSHAIGRRRVDKVHLGLAVDTRDGLFVPVIFDVASYSATQLRDKIGALKEQVKARKIPAKELRGNTITLSNFGSLGGKYANPVVVPPTVAIIGAGRCFQQLAMREEKVVEQKMLPLSLTFDHRAVTGAEAARFMAALREHLEKTE